MRTLMIAMALCLSLCACRPRSEPGHEAALPQSNRVPGEAEAPPPPTNSPWDAAKARGVAFRGVGNEPGWFVEVDHGQTPRLRATLDYGERGIEVARMQPLAGSPGFSGTTADGTGVVLRIQRETCSDGMSDERHPASVEFTVGEQAYRGCGRFLVD